MIENNFFSSKKTTHLIVNLMIWCTGALKFLGVLYNLPFFKQAKMEYIDYLWYISRYSCMNSHPTHHSYTQPIKK